MKELLKKIPFYVLVQAIGQLTAEEAVRLASEVNEPLHRVAFDLLCNPGLKQHRASTILIPEQIEKVAKGVREA